MKIASARQKYFIILKRVSLNVNNSDFCAFSAIVNTGRR